MSVCHGGNSDDLVSISAMTGTVAVNFCLYFNGLYKKKKKKKKKTDVESLLEQRNLVSIHVKNLQLLMIEFIKQSLA